MNRNFFFAHPTREEKCVHFFDVPATFRILSSPLHSSLRSLIADCNPKRNLVGIT